MNSVNNFLTNNSSLYKNLEFMSYLKSLSQLSSTHIYDDYLFAATSTHLLPTDPKCN